MRNRRLCILLLMGLSVRIALCYSVNKLWGCLATVCNGTCLRMQGAIEPAIVVQSAEC